MDGPRFESRWGLEILILFWSYGCDDDDDDNDDDDDKDWVGARDRYLLLVIRF